MVRKKDNYDLWLKERKMRRYIRNKRRKSKKESERTWKCGCLITFKTLDSNRKWKRYVCRMVKRPPGMLAHICNVCKILNGNVPCLSIMTNTHKKCNKKRADGVFPYVIGKFDKHDNYHIR